MGHLSADDAMSTEKGNESTLIDDHRSVRNAQGRYWSLKTLKTVLFVSLLSIYIFLAYGGYEIVSSRIHKFSASRCLSIEQRVDKILSETPLIDGHNDLAILLREFFQNHIYSDKFSKRFENGGFPMHVDLPRLREGKVGGSFWSAYVDCPAKLDNFSDETYAEAVRTTLSQIDLIHRLRNAYPQIFSTPHLTGSAARAVFQQKTGQLISPIGIEGLHQIGNSIATLRLYHSLGVRYATLTHNCHNKYADAALVSNEEGKTVVSKPLWGGTSAAGRKLIREMNRLGMLVDLSHVSADTMRDVLGGHGSQAQPQDSLGDAMRPARQETCEKSSGRCAVIDRLLERKGASAAPVIFSHSSAYAVCPHPRNVPDDVLELVRETGSLVMVNFSPDFISCVSATTSNESLSSSTASSGLPHFYPANATLSHVVSHIQYIGDLIGYSHVGLGSDFDGIPTTPKGLEDVSKYPDLVAEMLRRGISDEDAAKVVGGNLLRVWEEADLVAAKLQQLIDPLEDDI
ncbi:hypothetical protein L228DRAFT_235902 [Xylona heveae TC161]|uniref:Dipeptidase n=1 Tax=Xylona heveae (strain CBS 132557 / TC161) TaxID=1328760 RepID=A0A165K1Z2_XYLHT|nr:hypothetical protein L228DRAFT_235902 [Xylona heveae TC161]KZF26896.1 hypothetical protein L228DRAFT_235902 [Xylona heveae TC161]